MAGGWMMMTRNQEEAGGGGGHKKGTDSLFFSSVQSQVAAEFLHNIQRQWKRQRQKSKAEARWYEKTKRRQTPISK